MKDMESKFFYKYQTIKNKNLQEDRTLDALFKRYAIFSNRNNFNDPFDSRIKLIHPKMDEVKELFRGLPSSKKEYMGKIFFANNDYFEVNLKKVEKMFDDLIDEYFFYCVSDNATNNLMWSHYSDSHYGFCIEFNTGFVPAQKVMYQKERCSLKIIDIIESQFNPNKGELLSKNVWYALRTKLDEWKYESEYRVHADNNMVSSCLEKNDKFIKIEYYEESIESIIFGYRMSKETREYIVKNIPYDVKFKQSVITDNSFKIIDFVM